MINSEQAANASRKAATERAANLFTRRGFVATAGLAAGAFGLAGCSSNSSTSSTAPTPATTAPPTISDVLNFALNLEYLEATFYLTLATGSGLQTADQGTSPGAVSGLSKLTGLSANAQAVLNQLAADEQAHVQFLRATMTALGLTPVDLPALNLAALTPSGLTTEAQFIATARALETTGVSAYEGAIQFLVDNTTALNYAAQIHDTEGQHEGVLRQLCIAEQVVSPAVDASDLQPYLSNGTINIFNTNPSTGLNTARNTSQVLQIVYGTTTTGVMLGGFYPNGVNGNIKST